ncbi:uncharacterized protein LOC108833253 [Raphanus sativus]|uniref:Uncharacterized protein LOC108833253 n=1 Tax=Raphanus sativus TaxID=3726 RepID=A0A6J0LQP2_RAPSA|nr:uncharacterized protein LOC108833253 [Raphanus sativus]
MTAIPVEIAVVLNAGLEHYQTIGDYNRPDRLYTNRSAIRPPAIQRKDFELKPKYLSLVGKNPFHGLPHENPIDHIEALEDFVSNIKMQGVSEDYLFCKLFPHSLDGDATCWLKQLRPGSLTCWSDIKSAFLKNFFDDARTEEFRNNIYNFSQGTAEAFKASWVRFKGYQRDCLHHGLSEIQLLNIFFRGLDLIYQLTLDAASQGNFKTRSPKEATRLIENIATSTSTAKVDLERRNMEISNGDRISKTSSHEGDEEEHVNLIDQIIYYKQKLVNPQINMRSTRSHEEEQTHESIVESKLEEILKDQQNTVLDADVRFDSMCSNFNKKFKALSDHLKVLESRVSRDDGFVRREKECLPRRIDTNPKRQVCSVLLRSGKRLVPTTRESVSNGELAKGERTEKCGSKPIILDDSEPINLSDDKKEDSTIDRQSKQDIDQQKGKNIDRRGDATIDRRPTPTTLRTTPVEPVTERMYKPLTPFPPNTSQTKRELDKAICKKALENITVEMPLSDAMKVSPPIKKYVKDMVSKSFPSSENSFMMVSEDVSAIIQGETPIKRPDPGSFVLDCNIKDKRFDR